MDMESLARPFRAEQVHWRIGSTTQDKKKGMALAYIDARDVMDRLDEICGPNGWQVRFPIANSKTCCEIGVRFADEWIWKSDGAGDTDVEGSKGAFSDAFKRAAVHWGIGRYLYGLDSPWVAIEPAGRSFKIKKSEFDRLKGILAKATREVAYNGPPGDKVKFQDSVRAYWRDVLSCEDGDTLTALRTSTEGKDLETQCAAQLPDWWFGADGKKGLAVVIAERETELNNVSQAAE